MDPCGTNFTIEDLTLDTGPGPNQEEGAPQPDVDVEFQDVRVQCGGDGPPPDGNGQPPDGDGTNDGAAAQECPDGSFRETEHINEDRDTGEPEGQHRHDTTFDIAQECFGNPKGGVDAGFGGTAKSTEVKAASVLPPIIGSALVLVGLTSGGLALARRR